MRAELESLAVALADAWNSGRRVPEPAGSGRPRDRSEAYWVQDRMAELLGADVGGWKIGAALRAVQIAEGHDGPIPGRIMRNRIFIGAVELPYAIYADYNAELEYAFRLKHTLPARNTPYTLDEAAVAVNLVPGIEIAGSRLHIRSTDAKTMLAIADNGSGGAFVFGEDIVNWQGLDLDALPIEAGMPGEPVELYRGGQRGDVVAVLAEMINGLLSRGIALSAGDYLSTGSLCVPLRLRQGQPFDARFGDLGRLRVTLV
ncbi:2-keto-4-pentenoate hydratase [Chelatococcus sp. GCM10030263]|uniref:2-keto-4-pentenoate hydratase n=1 Tax=Chelatococcus sp. GCM10030263 TaxID=3273387 RepID=UPI0036124695